MKKYWQIWVAVIATIVIGVLCTVVAGSPLHYNIKYGEAATLDFCLYDSNSPWALYETAPATADVNVFRDQGVSESADNAIVDEGPFFSWTISAAEATAKTITLVIQDATAPPAYMDSVIVITTFGDASALHTFDLDSATASADIQAVDGNTVAAANMLAVYGSTNFLIDFNSTTKMWNVDVKYVHGETPEADVVDTLNTRIDGVDANMVLVQADVNTIEGYTDDVEGYLDTEIALIIAELAEADANNLLTKTYALAAQTAAEKLDTASELRLLLNASGGEVANEPNQTLILTDTAAQDEASEWTTLGAGIGGTFDFNDLFAMTPSQSATEYTIEWIFAKLQKWINSKR